MSRLHAIHSGWEGDLILSDDGQTLTLDFSGETARYVLKGDHLQVYWHRFPPELFIKCGDDFVFDEHLHPERRRPHGAPIIQILPQGNLGNQMIQYLAAEALRARVPGAYITGHSLPQWNRFDALPQRFDSPLMAERFTWHDLPLGKTAQRLNERSLTAVVLSGYFQRLSQLPSVEESRLIFSEPETDAQGFGDDTLVINIRSDDILSGLHRHYTLIPVNYYREIIETTKLRPVFFGQLSNNSYHEYLKKHFPDATFINGTQPIRDFQTLRNSKNLVLCVSTFSWLAGWLSNAQRIYMPLTGFFNPFQDREPFLVPCDDPRYIFHLFPVNFAVPPQKLEDAHRKLDKQWVQIGPGALRSLIEAAARAQRPSFEQYKALNEDEIHNHFDFDEQWYAQTYLDAAIDVGQGRFTTLRDHYILKGQSRGYAPCPRLAEALA